MRKVFVFLFLFFICISLVYADLAELGINPLSMEIGSRPLGMGAAYAGLADDVNAVLYNPGGMAWAKGVSLSITSMTNIAAVQAYPTGYGSSFGFAVVTNKISDIPIPTGIANSESSVVLLSYGTKLSFLPQYGKQDWLQRIGIGANLKGLMGQRLTRTGFIDRSASGWDLDLGFLWKGDDWWTAGLSMQNILPARALGGGSIKWDIGGEEEGIPSVTKIAASARVIGDIDTPIFMEGRELVISGELDFSLAKQTLLRLGGEWNFSKEFYIRTGIMQQSGGQGVSSDLNFGVGYLTEKWGIDFATYREPAMGARYSYLSVLYFPQDWIVFRRLSFNQPSMILEEAIEQISLVNNAVTYDEKIEVFGKVKPGVDVYINDLRAAIGSDYSFKTVVPLHLKKNLVVVEARYESEKKTWKYKVLRKKKVELAEEKKVKEELEHAVTSEDKKTLAEKEKEILKTKEKVETLVTMGVIEVSPEADFAMDAGITRGELATWLVKASGAPLPEIKENLYVDVPATHPLAPYIFVVNKLKILQHFPDGTFRPDALVSKDEGAIIFKRIFQQTGTVR
ncbi:hypothetical protein A3H38_04515 [candidate division WOR-1 bacterium RIFCSPLOWO2_02_FULL_46_20]|uniref:SLH domain-containing protein n=2 Tax=Saganbacteria TaxID=1703751 RepID=A0A1F4RGH4_UNCSA|nr:MAG: hypothetical protein A3J44_03255 [candidate division WOR-1 bacterium RIFCSPHIGHO2_02_FULL_45_12]OGC07314.1 MAG: hypothetical protein A3H38_04515 [candidate division WOR-1 bacterium RIFCSPLOWO2_02_FULL_46_20]OGC08456.1 MAG: hypothetical protein A3F86_03470 [candidate division WOR-1 bacterium RIFCSPLOWO2_12_FULL_45_9]